MMGINVQYIEVNPPKVQSVIFPHDPIFDLLYKKVTTQNTLISSHHSIKIGGNGHQWLERSRAGDTRCRAPMYRMHRYNSIRFSPIHRCWMKKKVSPMWLCKRCMRKDAFYSASGTFTVPESGVNLFMLRGKVSPNKDPDRKFHILILSNSEKA